MQKTCPKHGFVYESEGGTKFKYLIKCPKCVEEEEAHIEETRIAEERAEKLAEYERMNIEPEYYSASISNFYATTPEQKTAVEKVHRLIKGEIQQLVMVGKNGTGKTHLAIAAVKVLHGKIFSMYEISTRIRTTYAPNARETELQIVDELSRAPLLVIDEMGRTKGSDAELNWLSYIIDKRHSRGLPLILISNKHPAKNCLHEKGCPDCLENYIGEDVMSRITDGGVIAYFSGDDYRKKKTGTRSVTKEHV